MTQDDERLVYTVEEAGRKLRLSRGLMYQAIRDGQLPSVRVGRRILVPRAALERFLEQASRIVRSEVGGPPGNAG